MPQHKQARQHRWKKSNLPTKICRICHRPFTWRKKWKLVWEEVRYCSRACRNTGPSK